MRAFVVGLRTWWICLLAMAVAPVAASGERIDLNTDFNLRWLGAANQFVGISAASNAGDVNGDGVPDALVVNPGGPGSVTAFYVTYGQRPAFRKSIALSRLNAQQGYVVRSPAAGPTPVAANAGDVNGDGVPDALMGVPPDASGGPGAVYLVYGQRTALPQPLDLSHLTPSQGYRIDGTSTDGVGGAAASAGDVNGDGVPDALIGSPGLNGSAGGAWIVYGQRTGMPTTIDLSKLTPTQGYRINGAPGDEAGSTVANAGDVNRDGVPDALIGAIAASYGAQDAGSAYLVYGQRSANPQPINLANLGAGGYRLDGHLAFGDAGGSVANAGDVNHDGTPDALVGRPGTSSELHGGVFVVYGRRTPPGAPINLDRLSRGQGYAIGDSRSGSQAGYSVADAGDVNRDGVPDALIGAPGFTSTLDAAAYVVYGQRGPAPARVNLARLPPPSGYAIGGVPGAMIASHVDDAGDVDGDHHPDALVAAPAYSPSPKNVGVAWVVPALAPAATSVDTLAPAKRGVVAVHVVCAAAGRRCHGTLTLTWKNRRLGARDYSIAANRSAVVRVALSGAARALLDRAGALSGVATTSTSRPFGPRLVRSRPLSLRHA